MQNFIHRKNLEHYRKLLAQTEDDGRRQMILKLLAAEEVKDAVAASTAKDETPES